MRLGLVEVPFVTICVCVALFLISGPFNLHIVFTPAEGGGIRVGSRDLPQGGGWRVRAKTQGSSGSPTGNFRKVWGSEGCRGEG